MFETMDRYDGWQPADDGVPPPDDPDTVGMCLDPDVEAAGWLALSELEDSLAERVENLDAEQTLDRLAETQQSANRALARQLALAAHWADLHAVLDTPTTTPGGERLVRLGGDGTPEVAEFSAAEFGAILGVSDSTANHLVADALDLRHRFPMLWDLVQAGAVKVWVARKAADRTRKLSKDAAGKVDQKVARVAGRLSWGRLRNLLDAAMLAADPPKALSDAEQAAAEAGVWVSPDAEHGYGSMFVKAAAGDLLAFDQALDLIARALKILGDPGTPDQRRAKAVGILANPQAAQDLVARAEQTRRAAIEAAAARRAGNPEQADEIESRVDRRPCVFGPATLYYHLCKETLDAILSGAPFAGAGVVRVEDIGPVILDQVREWLQHSNVTIRPVLDLPGMPAIDRYEVPDRMSEAIGLEKPADYFPFGTSLSRHQDNEHTKTYVPMNNGGPPGQTAGSKMGKMTRHHHRVKTHGRWKVIQPGSGVWIWRSPHGQCFLVDRTGTTALGKL
jgi:Domain of unknown function (DUF222)